MRPTFFRAAYRIWVTELRPAWAFVAGGDPPPECRVLLAELSVHVEPTATAGQWALNSKLNNAVTINEDDRPFLVPMQLVQEWLDRPAPTADRPVVAWGTFNSTGNTLASSGNLTASQPITTDKTIFQLKFATWSATASYLVKGAPVVGFKATDGAFFAAIQPGDPDLKAALGATPATGIFVRAGVPTGTNTFGPVGFSVEITPVG